MTKRIAPSRSSTLSPKIQRNHMLPMRCIQPPCRNIDVKIDPGSGSRLRGAMSTQLTIS